MLLHDFMKRQKWEDLKNIHKINIILKKTLFPSRFKGLNQISPNRPPSQYGYQIKAYEE